MRKRFILPLLLLTGVFSAQAQQPTASTAPQLYNPKADARHDIQTAVAKAAREQKHVLLQIGGNWCIWCIRFNNLVTTDSTLKKRVEANYVVEHINYSPENRNEAVLAELGYPQRFGFPVFVILDGKGNRIHTQNSAYLEEGKDHNPKVVDEFLQQWSPKALDPKAYSPTPKP